MIEIREIIPKSIEKDIQITMDRNTALKIRKILDYYCGGVVLTKSRLSQDYSDAYSKFFSALSNVFNEKDDINFNFDIPKWRA